MSVNWGRFRENDKGKFSSTLKKNQEMFRAKMNDYVGKFCVNSIVLIYTNG